MFESFYFSSHELSFCCIFLFIYFLAHAIRKFSSVLDFYISLLFKEVKVDGVGPLAVAAGLEPRVRPEDLDVNLPDGKI